MNTFVSIAVREIGVREIPGHEHNERILQYAQEAGFSQIHSDEEAWCSIFLNWVAMKAGLERSSKANARSWLAVGQPVEHPEPGDVVIFWRESLFSWKGHVGIYLGVSFDQQRIYTLGGNQGDQVSHSAYAMDRLLGFRRLRPSRKLSLPEKVLRRGDTGPEVKSLQDALKMAHLNPGTSDGIFGARTERAVKELQTMNQDLEISGVFDHPTRQYLLEVVNH